MPRVVWSVGYAALSDGTVAVAQKLGVPKKVSRFLPVVWMIGPHIGQAWTGLAHDARYQANGPDWVYDAWNRSYPMQESKVTWLAGDVGLFCFARP